MVKTMSKEESFNISGKINLTNNSEHKIISNKKALNFANQKVSIKVGKDVKADLETIKITEKVKYDYETIQLLVDSYKNSLSPENKKKYNIIHDTFAKY